MTTLDELKAKLRATTDQDTRRKLVEVIAKMEYELDSIADVGTEARGRKTKRSTALDEMLLNQSGDAEA